VLAVAVTNQGGVAPQQQQQHAAAGGNRAMILATLMPTPTALHNLWQEYEHGVGGRMAARLFPILSAVAPSTSITEGKLCGIWLVALSDMGTQLMGAQIESMQCLAGKLM
jgi:hypothetical protein